MFALNLKCKKKGKRKKLYKKIYVGVLEEHSFSNTLPSSDFIINASCFPQRSDILNFPPSISTDSTIIFPSAERNDQKRKP